MNFVLLTVFLDMLGVGLIVPVLPRLIAQFVPDPSQLSHWYGIMIATYSIAQFFAAPVLGALSDRFGRRPVLLLCVFGLGVDFLLVSLAPDLWWMLATRVLGGLTGGNLSVANAYVADVSAPEDRSRAMGMVGAMFGLGFICGPVIGGLLGSHNPHWPFWLAAGVSFVNVAYGWFMLPESLPVERRNSFSLRKANPFSGLIGLARLKSVGDLLGVIALSLLAQFVMHTTWVISMEVRFGWSPLQNGLSLFLGGVSAALVQGVLMKPLLARLGERRLALAGLASSVVACLLYGVVQHSWMIYMLILCNMLGFAIAPALQGTLSREVAPNQQGFAMGSLASLGSVASILAPLLGTSLLGRVSHLPAGSLMLGAPFFLASSLQACALLLAWRHFRRHREN